MNTGEVANLERILSKCIADNCLHSKLLNTFACLENAGARKISRFQRFGFVDDFVLRHAAEEARHALYFKAKGKLQGFGENEILAGHSTRNYLRKIDISANRYIKMELQKRGKDGYMLAYLMVTLLIEERADFVYGVYERLLRKVRSEISLRSLLAEEDRHRRDICRFLQEKLGAGWRSIMDHLRPHEERVYRQWIMQVEKDLWSTANLSSRAGRASDLSQSLS